MKPVKGYTFNVEGSFDFPFDMLRYDRCWPANEAQINDMVPHHRSSRIRERRVVTLRGLNKPTEGRWESFGWHVKEINPTSINV